MAAGAWTFTNASRTYLLDGTFDLNTDTFLMAQFLSTSDLGASSTTYAGVSNQHANANDAIEQTVNIEKIFGIFWATPPISLRISVWVRS